MTWAVPDASSLPSRPWWFPLSEVLRLIRGRARPELGRILLALACYAAGFAYLVVFEDDKFVGRRRWWC